MKFAVLIPDRVDRPRFMNNCLRMMKAQTLPPDEIKIIDYPSESDQIDITQRYRKGYDELRNKGIDLIAFIENDDWYSPDYLEKMIEAWNRYRCPDLLGTCYTIYYHLKFKAYFTMEHHQRSSAMNTFIRADLDFPWCADNEPYTDLHLWDIKKNLFPNRILFRPEKHLSIGMKHNVGKCGGNSHIPDARSQRRYCNPDNGFLKSTLDAESFVFYDTYFDTQ